MQMDLGKVRLGAQCAVTWRQRAHGGQRGTSRSAEESRPCHFLPSGINHGRDTSGIYVLLVARS